MCEGLIQKGKGVKEQSRYPLVGFDQTCLNTDDASYNIRDYIYHICLGEV
jgi:hypothetical protein